MRQTPTRSQSLVALVTSGTLMGWGSLYAPAFSQIIPDESLGTERSVFTNGVITEAGLVDLINGGASRGDALFHSFSDFNVNEGQRVYFANPATIENIVGRVTGVNASAIFGTLGVLGSADLYLINPNGIVFGPNAELDIRGSFLGSTAPGLTFDNGYTFSAVNPDVPPLLTVNSSVGLASWLPPTAGAIANSGNLAVGQDLTLVGNALDIQGSLTSGGDLSLLATESLTVRDTATTPFLALAGNALLLQGNQNLDIFTLNHPESGLVSGSDLVLRSDNPVLGDAHYEAGGDLRLERVDGSPGILTSPNDPVLRASGDVSLASYTGASLHILAGGSVSVGDITITGPDALGNALQEQVTLSDGVTVINIDGNAQPTLDVRAGTLAFGVPGATPAAPEGFVPGVPATDGTGTSANITLGNVLNPGGWVLITNQYQPNPLLQGNITVGSIDTSSDPATGLRGGSVAIDSRGGLTFSNINVSGGTFELVDASNEPNFSPDTITGDSGDVTLLADGDIFMPYPSTIYALGLRGGGITFASDTAIIQEAPPTDALSTPSWIENDSYAFDPDVKSGDIRLTAPFISLGGQIITTAEFDAQGGDVILTSDTLVTETGGGIATRMFGLGRSGNILITTATLQLNPFSAIGTINRSFEGGEGGNVVIEADTIAGTGGGQITALATNFGDAGTIDITAQDMTFSGFLIEELAGGEYSPSGIVSSVFAGAEGNGGDIRVTTNTLSLSGGAAIASQVRSTLDEDGNLNAAIGNSGYVTLHATESIQIDGAVNVPFASGATGREQVQPTAINSELDVGVIGTGGNLSITTPVLIVTGGASISTITEGEGDAGNLTINATESLVVDGIVDFTAVGEVNSPSRIEAYTAEQSAGNAGNLTITTPFLSLTNNGQVRSETRGVGNAGTIKLNVSDTLLIEGGPLDPIDTPDEVGNVDEAGSGIFASTLLNSTGQGGSIIIDPQRVLVLDGGQISVLSAGLGTAGDIVLISEELQLGNGLITAETLNTADGGNITLTVPTVIVLQNGSRISATAGTALAGGDGGNITIDTLYLVATPEGNNDITANAFAGAGGRVVITAEGIFGLTPRSRAELEQLLGTTDPALLDPSNLASSDITAISRENPELDGQVIIQSPDIDPNQGVVALPENIVDASRLIAQGCSSGGAIAQEIGSLVVTGRGGIPATPTDALGSRQVLLDWATTAGTDTGDPAVVVPYDAIATPTPQLVEVQSLVMGPHGEVMLVAQADESNVAASLPTLTCAGEIQEAL